MHKFYCQAATDCKMICCFPAKVCRLKCADLKIASAAGCIQLHNWSNRNNKMRVFCSNTRYLCAYGLTLRAELSLALFRFLPIATAPAKPEAEYEAGE